MKNNFDIFISYRRDGGFEIANILYDRLTRAGYRVFMDVEKLRSGKFNVQLYKQIDCCKDILVVLGPNSLERCKNEGDWLRLEISHAIKSEKNIIPVLLRNFKFPEEQLPVDIAELSNYQGIEASHELFNAFVQKLKGMLLSKQHITWNRFKKYLLFLIAPIIISICILFYIHTTEQKQYEQICKEVVSTIGVGFGNDNELVSIMDNVHKEWYKFHANIQKTTINSEKERYRQEYTKYIDYNISQIKDSNILTINLSQNYEEILTKNGIKTEDIKATKMIFKSNIELTRDYLNKIKFWVNAIETGWAKDIDQAMSYNFEMNKLIIISNIYPYIELIKTMPTVVRENYLQILPSLTQFPEVGFDRTKEELEALQQQSIVKINNLLQKYSAITGDEGMRLEKAKNLLDSLETRKKVPKIVFNDPKIDSIKKDIALKKEHLNQSKVELDTKKQELRQLYESVFKKFEIVKGDDQSIMWGKILRIAKIGNSAIENQKNIDKEYLKLKEEFKQKGWDPKLAKRGELAVSIKEIFDEVQKRLDIYLKFENIKDPNAKIYVPIAKLFYQMVSEKKIDYSGILVLGIENNVKHPILKTGDIIISRKGKTILTVDDYIKLKDDPSPNVVTIIRFTSSGAIKQITETIPLNCTIKTALTDLIEK